MIRPRRAPAPEDHAGTITPRHDATTGARLPGYRWMCSCLSWGDDPAWTFPDAAAGHREHRTIRLENEARRWNRDGQVRRRVDRILGERRGWWRRLGL